jgi:DNA-directed RNA polymerase specialized sigma24 family protein
MNGEKQKDIGARLGIKQSAVSHRVSKARRILNEQIMTEVRRNLRLDRPEYYEEEEDWQIHE